MSTAINLTQNQLKVLLLGSGFVSVTGLTLNDDVVDEHILLNTLNELVKKGFLVPDDKSFIMNDELRKIIVKLGKSRNYNVIHSYDVFLPDLCCYGDEDILVCSLKKFNTDHYTMSFYSSSELFDKLNDEGYFPAQKEDFELNESELLLFEENFIPKINRNVMLDENLPIVFSLEFAPNEIIAQKYMRVIKYYFYDYILWSDGKKIERLLFNHENAKKIFSLLWEA